MEKLNITSIEVTASRVEKAESKLTMQDFWVCTGFILALLFVLGSPTEIPAGLGPIINSAYLL